MKNLKDALYNKIAQAKGYANIKDMLEDLYSTKGLSQTMIADLVGCSLPTIKTLREQHGIESKPKALAEKLIIPKKELKKQSCIKLATKYKTSKSTIWRLKREAKTPVGRSHIHDEET